MRRPSVRCRRPAKDSRAGPIREAPAAFDNRTNGFDPQGPAFDTIDEDTVVPLRSFNDNRFIFEEVETVADGLGPTFNAQACRECHQNIVTGGASQIAEHRTGRLELLQFVESIGGSLIQSRSTHPDIFERVPFEDSVEHAPHIDQHARRRLHRGHCQFHVAGHS